MDKAFKTEKQKLKSSRKNHGLKIHLYISHYGECFLQYHTKLKNAKGKDSLST